MTTDTESKAEKTARNKEANLSKDKHWKSFPRVPNLLQYVSTGTYYARVKQDGKVIRKSLRTDVWTTAKLRLNDFLKEVRTIQHQSSEIEPPLFSEALSLYEDKLKSNTSIKPKSIEYRQLCISKIRSSWPEVLQRRLNEISELECRDWAAKLKNEIASHYFNNTISTFKQIFEEGEKDYRRRGGKELENPATNLSRVRVRQKELKLPEPSQMKELIANIQAKSGGWGDDIADLIEFLTYSGMRAFSEAKWFTWEDIDWKRKELIVRGDPITATKNGEIRRVPIIPNMEELLSRLKSKLESRGKQPTGKLLQVSECRASLTRACNELGLYPLTHHDLRHLFATRCIESGVDIPTVARWLGHKDGGALAMKTYGHLRNEHSQAMAQKVRF